MNGGGRLGLAPIVAFGQPHNGADIRRGMQKFLLKLNTFCAVERAGRKGESRAAIKADGSSGGCARLPVRLRFQERNSGATLDPLAGVGIAPQEQ